MVTRPYLWRVFISLRLVATSLLRMCLLHYDVISEFKIAKRCVFGKYKSFYWKLKTLQQNISCLGSKPTKSIDIYWTKLILIKVIAIENLGLYKFWSIRILWNIHFWRFLKFLLEHFCEITLWFQICTRKRMQ